MTLPTLILLPGLHGTANLFAPLLKILPQHIPTKTFTYPTHRFSTHKSLLPVLTQELQNEQDIILLAESFSGPLALAYANQCKNPARIRALVLAASFIAPPVPRILSYLAALPILTHFPILSPLIRFFVAGSRAPKLLVKQTRQAIRANNPLVLSHRVAQAAHINAKATLQSCPVPILCLAGTRDRLIGPRALCRIKRVRPDIVIRTFSAPHLLLQTCPRAVWHAIASFPPIAACYNPAEITA